jgi:multiple sugar transport system substrate-binding protein
MRGNAVDRLVPYDFPEPIRLFCPKLEAAFRRKLLSGIAKTRADWKAFIADDARSRGEGEGLHVFQRSA